MKLGIDIGASAITLVVMNEQIIKKERKEHHGNIKTVLVEMLKGLEEKEYAVVFTGNRMPYSCHYFDIIPCMIDGVKREVPEVKSMIEIGSQSAYFITNLQGVPQFNLNEHCASGTGSFFEDQMSRLGLNIEDYSSLVDKATNKPGMSGRCAVFAKTDIIHLQQEGVAKEDILNGLCYALIRNYKTSIVRGLKVESPLVFAGGVTLNSGVKRAIEETFKKEIIIPLNALYLSAIGAAMHASEVIRVSKLIQTIEEDTTREDYVLPPLSNEKAMVDHACTHTLDESTYLGIDIGSTSTNLVLLDSKYNLIDFLYLRTAGEPERVVREGLYILYNRYPNLKINGAGITGSGRQRLGELMKTDVIIDEITAQAKCAAYIDENTDTVFEIGGQDSKYISLKNKEVIDFTMNKICAAGTGSFIEEKAISLDIPLNEYGNIAISSQHPYDLGERCTVFIESNINHALTNEVNKEDIASGLCYSIVKNYLHKVVGNKKIGDHIVLQGGICYNPALVAAFKYYYPTLKVNPYFSVSGAVGVALIASNSVQGESTFLGKDFPSSKSFTQVTSEEIRKNRAMYKQASKMIFKNYDPTIDPKKKTIGVPLVLVMYKFFPLCNAFFKDLGYNVVLSGTSNQEIVELSQQSAIYETCYPIKLIYGHMQKLIDQKVDYIFSPRIRTIRHETSKAKHTYACPFMQTATLNVFNHLDHGDIELLSPIFDLELGQKNMAESMVSVGVHLGFSKPRCLKALALGAAAVKMNSQNIEKIGHDFITSLKPDEKALVIITRAYGYSDAILNMSIPDILLSKGYKVINLSYLPEAVDLSDTYPNMYWPFGDHILSGARYVKSNPNLYAIYITNHGCGPDSILSHLFKEEMGDKPYLQIEVDEHFSKVGVITRIEAFLNALSHHTNQAGVINEKKASIYRDIDPSQALYIPSLGIYNNYMIEYFKQKGVEARVLPEFDHEVITLGKQYMNSKEYIPFSAILGSILKLGKKDLQVLIPTNYGSDSDGQYMRAILSILDSLGYNARIVSPILEECMNDELFKALLTGDLKANGIDVPDHILEYNEIREYAKELKVNDTYLLGTPLCITSLNHHLLDSIEGSRMSLAEYMYFLSRSEGYVVKEYDQLLSDIFNTDMEELMNIKGLEHYSAANGRYRFAKIVTSKYKAIIHVAPRYENTTSVLSMSGMYDKTTPVYTLFIDDDYDEKSLSNVKSFIYYCKKNNV